jgi:hypothetical protein
MAGIAIVASGQPEAAVIGATETDVRCCSDRAGALSGIEAGAGAAANQLDGRIRFVDEQQGFSPRIGEDLARDIHVQEDLDVDRRDKLPNLGWRTAGADNDYLTNFFS